VTYSVDWYEAALNTAAEYITDDPKGLDELFEALDRLADEPRPRKSKAMATPDLRRLRVGQYRALYEILESVGTIIVIHIGRVG
jgi:mRNA interferase RelE/StbE